MPLQADTVALVATDIESSTALWERLGEVFKAALDLHDQLLRQAIDQHRGYELRTEGDGFRVAFTSVVDAVRFCLVGQQRLARARWPLGLLGALPPSEFPGLRVRMGVHCAPIAAELDSVTGRVDFRGIDLHRAERVAEVAHGGQILLTGAAWAAVRDAVQRRELDLAERRLGRWRLPALQEGMDLWQVLPRSMEHRRFPPLRAQEEPAVPTNLRRPRAALLGRAEEMAWLFEVWESGAPFIEITGPPGVGKSALAADFASELAGLLGEAAQVSGGVWRCDAQGTRSVGDLSRRVLSLLDAPTTGSSEVWAAGAALAAAGAELLILDSVEGIHSELWGVLQQWWRQSPGLRVIAISRVTLALLGTRVLRLEPLALPDPAGAQGRERVAAMLASPAVALFLRASRDSSLRRGIEPPEPDLAQLEAIGGILELVGGLPLAIVLAAGRSGLLSPVQLRRYLAERPFEVLAEGECGPEGRPRSLRETLEASWHLLAPWEAAALVQLSVFAGSFDEEAAAHVVRLRAWPAAPEVGALLGQLEDQSWVQRQVTASGTSRWRLLGPVLTFLRAKAEEPSPSSTFARGGLIEAAKGRHARHFARLGASEAFGAQPRRAGATHLATCSDSMADLEAALEWAIEGEVAEVALSAAAAALEVYHVRGPPGRGRDLARRLLGVRFLSPGARAELLRHVAELSLVLGEPEAARAALVEALPLAEEAAQPRLVARTHLAVARLLRVEGNLFDALSACDRALKVARAADDALVSGLALKTRSNILRQAGRLDLAAADLDAAFRHLEAAGAVRQAALAQAELAVLQRERGELTLALETARIAAQCLGEIGDPHRAAVVRIELALILRDLGLPDEARQELEGAIHELRARDLVGYLGTSLRHLGQVALDQGDLERARAALEESWRMVDGGSHALKVELATALAELKARCGQVHEAMGWLRTAEELASQELRREAAFQVLCARACVATIQRNAAAASSALDSARRMATGLGPAAGARPMLARLERVGQSDVEATGWSLS